MAEGGTYQLQTSSDVGPGAQWTPAGSAVTPTGSVGQASVSDSELRAFYRTVRTSLADYDAATGTGATGSAGGISNVTPKTGTRGATITLTITLDAGAQPPPPPQNAPINSITVGEIAGANNVHVSPTQVTSVITIPPAATPGAQTVTVIFPGPPGNAANTVRYTLENGFLIQ